MKYKHIDIEHAKSILDYNPETGIFTKSVDSGKFKKGDIVGYKNNRGYVFICLGRTKLRAHRLAWAMHYGRIPLDEVDHINGIKFDNRIINLRECSSSQNKANVGLHYTNNSGFKGVSWRKANSKWKAQIQKNKKTIYLGCYENIEDAAKAYQEASKIHYGEFARIS